MKKNFGKKLQKQEVVREYLEEDRKTPEQAIRETKIRLYAYPQLKENVKKYLKDIEDLRKENFGKSKSIVSAINRGATPLEVEEYRAVCIRRIEMKIERDQAEINEIDRALRVVKDSVDALIYSLIDIYYFKKNKLDCIASKLPFSVSTASRQLKKMTGMISLVLYGADTLQKSCKK